MKFDYQFYTVKASEIKYGDVKYDGFDVEVENFATSIKISGIDENDELVVLNISNDEGDDYFWDGDEMDYNIDLDYFKSHYEDQFEKYLIFSSRTNHAGIVITGLYLWNRKKRLIKNNKINMSAENGRYYIQGKNGKLWCVEPISGNRISWGDVDPATRTLQKGTYGDKYKGSIEEEESIITKENGYKNIYHTGIGVSPESFIRNLEKNL